MDETFINISHISKINVRNLVKRVGEVSYE